MNSTQFPICLYRRLIVVNFGCIGQSLATHHDDYNEKSISCCAFASAFTRAPARPQEFKNVAGLRVADGIRNQLLSASADFISSVETGIGADPWRFGFAVIHKIDNVLIGMGGFPAPPDSSGVAEIAYGIATAYQGKGYATEVARALIDFASCDARVKTIRAHTLAQTNASTRVLEKCGFKKVGESTDPENGLAVWRWERQVSSPTE